MVVFFGVVGEDSIEKVVEEWGKEVLPVVSDEACECCLCNDAPNLWWELHCYVVIGW